MLDYFTHPWALLLLPLVALALWHFHRRSRGAVRVSSVALFAGLPRGRAPWLRRSGRVLRSAGCVLTVLALAGPRWPDEGSRIPTEGLSIAIVLDVSASMAEQDFPWGEEKVSRLDGVKKVFRLFVAGGEGPGGAELDGRPNDLLALVTFAARPETACPLTLDHAALLKILDAQEAHTTVGDATTNPGDALAWGLYVLKNAPTRRRVLLFLTDGESNVPTGLKPRQAAQLAGNLNVPIYALDAAPDPATAADAGDAAKARETLQTLARVSGGSYFRAQDGPALAAACRQIDRLERDRIVSFEYRRYHEAFAAFAVAALACWAALGVLESTVWLRSP
jgi:Ca-activated chloride channel homolog